MLSLWPKFERDEPFVREDAAVPRVDVTVQAYIVLKRFE
jgi:hypothetical protein